MTSVSGHTDADATLQILDGETVRAEFRIDVSLEGFQFKPWEGCIPITPETACSVIISASAADCQVNIGGYTI